MSQNPKSNLKHQSTFQISNHHPVMFTHQPVKSLGQNFLISEHIINRILSETSKFHPEEIVEVGPGLGALTIPLKELTSLPLVLLEVDKKLAAQWKLQDGVRVIEGDALKVDWAQLFDPAHQRDQQVTPQNRVLVSNLPYQISSSLLIERTIDEPSFFGAMILMFQKEVAQKILAKENSSNYGMLSIFVQTYWNVHVLLEASPRDFRPAPKVASRVLVFTPKRYDQQALSLSLKKRALFLKLLKSCFLHKRKLLISNLLESCLRIDPLTQLDRKSYLQIFLRLGWDEKIRPQQISPSQYLVLYQELMMSGSAKG